MSTITQSILWSSPFKLLFRKIHQQRNICVYIYGRILRKNNAVTLQLTWDGWVKKHKLRNLMMPSFFSLTSLFIRLHHFFLSNPAYIINSLMFLLLQFEIIKNTQSLVCLPYIFFISFLLTVFFFSYRVSHSIAYGNVWLDHVMKTRVQRPNAQFLYGGYRRL
jgi:hypothetical protein